MKKPVTAPISVWTLHSLIVDSVQSLFPIHANDLEQIVVASKNKSTKGLFTCNVAFYVAATQKHSVYTVAKMLAPEINKRLDELGLDLTTRISYEGYIYVVEATTTKS